MPTNYKTNQEQRLPAGSESAAPQEPCCGPGDHPSRDRQSQESGCCSSPSGSSDRYGEALQAVEHTFTTLEGKKKKRHALWSQGYTDEDLKDVPDSVLATTFGSGNPLALGEIGSGDVVVDIGSGAGLDAIIAARKVGPEGTVYGIDPSSRMLDRSRENIRQMDLRNVHFLEGSAERVPLPDATADVALSNCVLSCLTVGESAFREAFRILKPGGRLYVTDIIPSEGEKESRLLDTETYRQRLEEAGFTDVEVIRSRVMFGSQDECCSDGQPTVRVKARRPAE